MNVVKLVFMHELLSSQCAKSIERTYFKLGTNLIKGFHIHTIAFGSCIQHACYYFIEALVKIRFDMFIFKILLQCKGWYENEFITMILNLIIVSMAPFNEKVHEYML
jgi:hypothetical protein